MVTCPLLVTVVVFIAAPVDYTMLIDTMLIGITK